MEAVKVKIISSGIQAQRQGE